MSETIKYTCSCCGKEHEEWPSLAYMSPSSYNCLSEEDKEALGELDTDFCVIRYPEQTDRYIRATLNQQVTDHCEDLNYGLWVTLSENNFHDYMDNFNNEEHEVTYFGWLGNLPAEYEDVGNIPTTVYTKPGNQRPEIVPNKDFDHPFVKDYYKGITKKEAERRIAEMLRITREGPMVAAKPWWKFWGV